MDLAKGPPPKQPGRRAHPWGSGTIVPGGYVRVNFARRKALLHRLVMEHVLGRRLLRWESVHHRDGNKLNNCPENLAVLSNSQHVSLHRRRIPLVAYCEQCGRPFLARFARLGPQHFCSARCYARFRLHRAKTRAEYDLRPPTPPAA